MIIKKGFWLWLAVGCFLLVAQVAAAEGEARIFLTVDENSELQGWTVSAFIEKSPQIYGADMRLTFDPGVLKVVDSDTTQDGVQVGHGKFLDATQGFVLRNQADNENGVIDYVLALLNPAPPVEGDGLLAQVTFQANGEGETTVRFEKGQFGTQKGEVIDPQLVDDVTFSVKLNESTQVLEVETEAISEVPSDSETPSDSEGSTLVLGEEYEQEMMWWVVLGVFGGGGLLLMFQFVLGRLRSRSSSR